MAYMVEGGGAKSYNKARAWLLKHPKESHYLLGLITDVTVEYLVGQVRAGAQVHKLYTIHHTHTPYTIHITSHHITDAGDLRFLGR